VTEFFFLPSFDGDFDDVDDDEPLDEADNPEVRKTPLLLICHVLIDTFSHRMKIKLKCCPHLLHSRG
jgi:hypothetical protein